MGRSNQPFYRVVATDSRCSNSGRFLENLGWYDPVKAGPNFSLNMERVEYWTGNGALMSDTVKSLVRKARKGEAGVSESVAPPAEAIPATGPADEAEETGAEEAPGAADPS